MEGRANNQDESKEVSKAISTKILDPALTTARDDTSSLNWKKIAFWCFILALFTTTLVLTCGGSGLFGLGLGLAGINSTFATIGTLDGMVAISNVALQTAVGVLAVVCPVFISIAYLFTSFINWCKNSMSTSTNTQQSTEKNHPVKPKAQPSQDTIVLYPDDIQLHMRSKSYKLDAILKKLAEFNTFQEARANDSATLKTWGSRTRSEGFLQIKNQHILTGQTYIDGKPVTELIQQNFSSQHLMSSDLVKIFFEKNLVHKISEHLRSNAAEYLSKYFHNDYGGLHTRIFSFLPNYLGQLSEPFILPTIDSNGNSAQSCTLTFTTDEQGFFVTEAIIQNKLCNFNGIYLNPESDESQQPYDAIFKITETLQFDFINVDADGRPTITPIAGEIWYGHSFIESLMQGEDVANIQKEKGASVAYVRSRLNITSSSSTPETKPDVSSETPKTLPPPSLESLAPSPSAALSLRQGPQ